MKTIKFLAILMAVVLASCSPSKDDVAVQKLLDSCRVEMHKMDVPVIKETEAHPYINPVLIYGSSFGEFFQALYLYKTGKFEDMLAFTSSNSIEKFGRDKVLNFYKTMDFAYDIKLKSMNVAETPVGITTLNYTAGIMATRNMLRMEVVIENDSCKIVLKDLKSLR